MSPANRPLAVCCAPLAKLPIVAVPVWRAKRARLPTTWQRRHARSVLGYEVFARQGGWPLVYLYLILDLYSRKIVGWEVHGEDSADHAAHLVRRTAFAEGIAARDTKPVLHSDNGATFKATTVLPMLHWLGVKPSYSRPRVSDDNAFAESLFRTAKYRPEFPADGFADLDGARAWAVRFTHWYNFEHKHSGIRYVSPAQRHTGEDHAILEARHAVYMAARTRNPARWSGATRNWAPVGPVTLNPERDSVVNLVASTEGINQKAA